MNIIWAAEPHRLAEAAAHHVRDLLKEKPEASIALPTGDTPIGMYRKLAELRRAGEISFRQARLFNLDEYAGMASDDARSYHAFIRRHLVDHVDAAPRNVRLLIGNRADWQAECAAYDRAIAEAGGLDLAILGLGANGHIAFNEPHDPWDRETHIVTLAERTRQAHRPNFASAADIPRHGLTMGVKTLAAARQVLLLCAGESKRAAVAALLSGDETGDWPVTAIADHPRLTVIAEAALNPRATASPEKAA